jgi:energy-coupling factor transporter ATP-binding protein EcfA2
MSNKIIALRGRGGSGKTTTIHMLPAILTSNGYTQVPNMYQNHGQDFLNVYEKGTTRVGLTSSGDTFDLVNDRLTGLVGHGCQICICACRTYDRIPPGTIAATQNFPKYQNEYVDKTYANGTNNQLIANQNDAATLFRRI